MSAMATHFAPSDILPNVSVGPKPPKPIPTLLKKAVIICIASYVDIPEQVIRNTDIT